MLTTLKESPDPELTPDRIDLLQQLIEDLQMERRRRCNRRGVDTIRRSGLAADQQELAYSLTKQLLHERVTDKDVTLVDPACDLGVVNAFKLLGRRLPDLVRETTVALQSGRSTVDAETLAARICVVAAEAVVGFHASEDQIDSELRFYSSELVRAGFGPEGECESDAMWDNGSARLLNVGDEENVPASGGNTFLG